jgi:dTDP-3-amino-3,4,6-trideoxy-alpha-D-glucose transaminase
MSAAIPFFDARAGYLELADRLDRAALAALGSGSYVLGDAVADFERAFAHYSGVPHCIGVASGLDALTLALRALGIGAGDEVIVPANTFIATWLSVTATGAVPVPVEPDPEHWNITARAVAPAVTARTRAVICVHLHGRLAPTRELRLLCEAHDLALLEDAAQAHGATGVDGRAGALGDAAAFSFYPTKNLGAFGDGGAVTTASGATAARVARLRNYGSERKYEFSEQGVNSRLDALQAALLSEKLTALDEWNSRRRALVERYRDRLADVPGIDLPAPAGDEHVWHVFAVTCHARDELAAALAGAQIGTLVHYPVPPHLSDAYKELGYGPGDFPISERLSQTMLSLPLYPQLSATAVDRVCGAVAHAAGRAPALR